MSDQDLTRFDDLLSRYLDASLGDADEHEFATLLADEALAARFHEATQLDVEIAGVLAGSVPDEVMIRLVWSDVIQADQTSPDEPTRKPVTGFPALVNVWEKRRRTPVLLAWAAMVVGLVGAALYLLSQASAPRVVDAPAKTAGATASSVRGEVYLVRSTGREPLAGGLSLSDGGTIQTVGRDSRVTVALRDGSKIELRGDTKFTAELGTNQRRLFLEEGMLVATVAKQPENAPMVFNTDRATATVRGTQLALVAETTGSYLIVTEGAVALQRSSGGPEVLIRAGFYGHVELEGQFQPFPISRLPRALREELPQR
jgi:hypothetical protein